MNYEKFRLITAEQENLKLVEVGNWAGLGAVQYVFYIFLYVYVIVRLVKVLHILSGVAYYVKMTPVSQFLIKYNSFNILTRP